MAKRKSKKSMETADHIHRMIRIQDEEQGRSGRSAHNIAEANKKAREIDPDRKIADRASIRFYDAHKDKYDDSF